MEFRNLEKVRSILKDATVLDVSYAYDDLVFPDNTVFIIQFDDSNATNFFCHFQEECGLDDRKLIMDSLESISKKQHCSVIQKGSFRLEQKGEEVEIHFS